MFLTGIDTFQVSQATQGLNATRKPVSATRPSDEDTQRFKDSQKQVGQIKDEVTLSKEAQTLSATVNPTHPKGTPQQTSSFFDR